MKRFLCLVLASVLAVGLMACGAEEAAPAAPAAEEKPAWTGRFSVGYGRADVTPDRSVVMSGYKAAGEATRVSDGVLNNLYITCIAMTDEAGDTVLLYTYDQKSLTELVANQLRQKISEEVGVPVEHIIISCTHTHSSPDMDPYYMELTTSGAVDAAKAAMEDRMPATVEYAATEIPQMTFVRHYNTDTGIVIGDNFKPEGAGNRTGHTTEADKELRLIRFLREGKKPILMANWLGHCTSASTGTTTYGKENHTRVSADYVGFCRDYVEQNYDCHFAMFMGASGNINVHGYMPEDPRQVAADGYGIQLGEQILTLTQTMMPGQSGDIKMASTQFQGTRSTFDICAIGAGSIGVITAPFEMFDTTSMAVREDSPYDVTFVLTLANGTYGYMATDMCYDYIDCYEVRSQSFFRGSAEKIVGIYVDLLQQTKG